MRISRKVVPLQPKKNVEPFKERKGRPNEYKVNYKHIGASATATTIGCRVCLCYFVMLKFSLFLELYRYACMIYYTHL